MRSLSDISFRVRSPKETLLFLLGLFSTWQIVQVGGFALSTWLTVLTAGYLILTHGLDFRKDWLLLVMLVFTGVTFAVSMVSDIPGGYIKASITGTAQWLLIFIICAYMRKEKTSDATDSFFQGFDWSCRVQLVWCILQKAFAVVGLNLNSLIFGDLLRLSIDPSLYWNSTISGLHWHVANLTPVLVYVYFRHKSLLLKALCLGVAFLAKSATPIIAVGLCVFFDLVGFCKRTLCDRRCAVPYRIAVYVMLGVLGVILVSPILLPKVWEILEYLLLRIYQIQNPTEGNESSAVHFNYYRFLPDVLNSIPKREVLFGSGIGTSGHRFTVLIWQFPDAIWTVESDPVNTILNQGIVGAVLHYFFFFYTAWHLWRKKQRNMTCFLLVLFICGFAYNNQFVWVLLVEMLLYCRARAAFPKKEKEM